MGGRFIEKKLSGAFQRFLYVGRYGITIDDMKVIIEPALGWLLSPTIFTLVVIPVV